MLSVYMTTMNPCYIIGSFVSSYVYLDGRYVIATHLNIKPIQNLLACGFISNSLCLVGRTLCIKAKSMFLAAFHVTSYIIFAGGESLM